MFFFSLEFEHLLGSFSFIDGLFGYSSAILDNDVFDHFFVTFIQYTNLVWNSDNFKP